LTFYYFFDIILLAQKGGNMNSYNAYYAVLGVEYLFCAPFKEKDDKVAIDSSKTGQVRKNAQDWSNRAGHQFSGKEIALQAIWRLGEEGKKAVKIFTSKNLQPVFVEFEANQVSQD